MMNSKYYFIKKKSNILLSFLYKIFRLLILLGISYLMLYPILTMLSMSMTVSTDLYSSRIWIPNNPTFMNFVNSLKYFDYFEHASISVQIAVISTLLQVVICPMVGYGLARYKFRGNSIIFMMVILIIIVPIQTAQIPMYIEYQAFDFFGIGKLIGLFTGSPLTVNLLNTKWVYYIPAMFGVGLNSGLYIFLFRQFFKGMPKDLEDAGKVDGCSRFMIYLKLMLPNAKPVIVTEILLSLIFYWNDSVIANMFMNTTDVRPIMPYTRGLLDMQSMLDEMQAKVEGNAITLMVVAPLMILFIVCQKYFIECMDRSGIKG